MGSAQEPLRLFISGDAGVSKSFIINAIYQSLTKTLSMNTSNFEKPRVLKLAPTGVASVNINGTTINTGLAIPIISKPDRVSRLSDQNREILRNKYSELKVIIIDEISMVANSRLLHIHQRLTDIYGTPSSQLFANLTVIVVGDLYQLPPIKSFPVYHPFKNDILNLNHPWDELSMHTIFNSQEDVFCSLAVAASDQAIIQDFENYPFATFFQIDLSSVFLNNFKVVNVLLLYRKQNNPFNYFTAFLEYLIVSKDLHVILGDFNFNALAKQTNQVQAMFSTHNFDQLVSSPTHIWGSSCLDQVYVKSEIIVNFKSIKTSVLSTHYSDHEAVRLTFSS